MTYAEAEEAPPGNIFLAMAKALLARGEDGEIIAFELAEAFRAVTIEGIGECDLGIELKRLLGIPFEG